MQTYCMTHRYTSQSTQTLHIVCTIRLLLIYYYDYYCSDHYLPINMYSYWFIGFVCLPFLLSTSSLCMVIDYSGIFNYEIWIYILIYSRSMRSEKRCVRINLLRKKISNVKWWERQRERERKWNCNSFANNQYYIVRV